MEPRFRCPRCGGTDLSVAVMVDPNTQPLIIPDHIEGGDLTYCNNLECGKSSDLWMFDTGTLSDPMPEGVQL